MPKIKSTHFTYKRALLTVPHHNLHLFLLLMLVWTTMSSKTPSHKMPFQHLHTLEFALQIASRDTKSQVVSVLCRFCTSFKQTEKEGVKRQRTNNTKYYCAPFCKENYDKHNSMQHSVEWEQYKKASKEQKIHFFKKAKPTSILDYIDMDSDAITEVFDKKIVDNIISKLFFCADNELEGLSLEKSVELFTQVPNTPSSYQVSIKNMKCFELSLDHTSIGLSFCQTTGVVDQHKQTFNNAKLVGLNNNLVSKYVQVGVAINLQCISDVLKSQQVWAFSLAGDGSTY